MPTREETYDHVRQIIDGALRDFGDRPENAWLGIYLALLWYEGPYIHVIDADKLRATASGRPPSQQWRQYLGQAPFSEKAEAKTNNIRVSGS